MSSNGANAPRTSSPPPPARPSSSSSTSPQSDRALQPRASLTNELATLQHQLRVAKGTIQDLQSKLGEKQSHAPFGSSTTRKGSLVPSTSGAVARRPSHGELSPALDQARLNGSASPIPGLVSQNRTLVSDDGGSPVQTRGGFPSPRLSSEASEGLGLLPPAGELERQPSPSLGSSKSNGSRASGGGNPFFGGNSQERMKASERSAQSGSGKVISGLQSELLGTKQALEATRNQLRLSQRAVEFLSRQNDDLKETKDRLQSEIDGLNKMLSRRERNQEEVLGRARSAESGLQELQAKYKSESSASAKLVKELEAGKRESDELRKKAESEYLALSKGMKSMSEGFKADVQWLKADLNKSEGKLAIAHSSLAKLHSSRSAALQTHRSALGSFEHSQREFKAEMEETLREALREAKRAAEKSEENEVEAVKVRLEYSRLRRTIQEHEREQQALAAAGGGATG